MSTHNMFLWKNKKISVFFNGKAGFLESWNLITVDSHYLEVQGTP